MVVETEGVEKFPAEFLYAFTSYSFPLTRVIYGVKINPIEDSPETRTVLNIFHA